MVELHHPSKRYTGIILKDKDPTNQGRYKVWISELMQGISQDKGIWCKNEVHKNRADGKGSGSYTPIDIGSMVQVAFHGPDHNTGYIVQVETDTTTECLPHAATLDDRDGMHVIYKTPNHGFVMFDNTVPSDKKGKLPGNSVHLYASKGGCKIILDGSGIHIYTSGDIGITANNLNIKTQNTLNLESSTINLKASKINIEGTINLKGAINSSKINGSISKADGANYASVAGGIGGGSVPSPGEPGGAAGNAGYGGPAEITT